MQTITWHTLPRASRVHIGMRLPANVKLTLSRPDTMHDHSMFRRVVHIGSSQDMGPKPASLHKATFITTENSLEIRLPPNYTSWREVFRCPGVEEAAMRMRRRVQIGMTLEFVGTQLTNFLYAGSGMAAFSTYVIENSNFLVGLHIFLVWRYYIFLRDAVLARHVTSIALATPLEEEAAPNDSAVIAIVTGPWTRLVELASPNRQALVGREHEQGSVPLGLLLQTGVLHVDTAQGESVDAAVLGRLRQGNHVVVQEEVNTDVDALLRACISPDKMLPFLAEAHSEAHFSAVRYFEQYPRLEKMFQWSGNSAMDFFGLIALGMGAGSVLVFAMPRH